jgi:hypothetical protein
VFLKKSTPRFTDNTFNDEPDPLAKDEVATKPINKLTDTKNFMISYYMDCAPITEPWLKRSIS